MKDLKGKRTGHGCPEHSFPALSPKDFRIFQAQCCSLPLKVCLCHPSSLLRARSRCLLGFQGGIPPSCLALPMVLSGTSQQGAPVPQSQGQVPCWARVSEALPPAPATEPRTAAAHQEHRLMEPLQRHRLSPPYRQSR